MFVSNESKLPLHVVFFAAHCSRGWAVFEQTAARRRLVFRWPVSLAACPLAQQNRATKYTTVIFPRYFYANIYPYIYIYMYIFTELTIWRAVWLTRILIMRGHAYTYFQFTLQLVAVYTPKANHMRSAAFTTRTLNQLTLFLPFRLILSFAFTPYRPLLRLIPLPRIPCAWNCICKSPLHSSVE